MSDAIKVLKAERKEFQTKIDTIDKAIEVLSGESSGRGKRGRKKRVFTNAQRAAISKAQKARWAKVRAAKSASK